MKFVISGYLKDATKGLKKVDTHRVVDALHRSGVPLGKRRSRSLWGMKKVVIPAIGLVAAGGYLLYRGLVENREVRNWMDTRWNQSRPADADKKDAVQQASEDSFPASDPPSWTAGTPEEVKKAES